MARGSLSLSEVPMEQGSTPRLEAHLEALLAQVEQRMLERELPTE